MPTRHALLPILTILLLAACQPAPIAQLDAPTADPILLWGVQEGFAIEKVADGFQFPVDIVFVPEPGPRPEDVRYYVAELYGTIKAVTNDGEVVVFAEDFSGLELPNGALEEYGIGGLCLSPEEGYLFVAWNEPKDAYQRFNYITRFRVTPGVFGTRPLEHQVEVGAGFFETRHVASNHQVGSCRVVDGLLYLSVGDGFHPEYAQDLTSFFGKILRTDMDLNPAPNNPYPPSDEPNDYSGYVFASGFRNPFALFVFEDGRTYVGDNGPDLDRFVAVHPGDNLGYDGTDNSIGANAMFSFYPAVGPSRLDYVPAGHPSFPPDYWDQFYLSTVGSMYGSGNTKSRPGILKLDVDQESERAQDVPEYLLRYIGADRQGLVAMAVASDGLYFSPLLPESTTGSSIYRLTYDPARGHPERVTDDIPEGSLHLLTTLGCTACHPVVGRDGNIGPSLDVTYLYARLDERVNSTAYLAGLDTMDVSEDEFLVATRPARAAVRAAQPGDERIRVWFFNHLKYTGFDNPSSQMPNLGLADESILRLSEILLREPTLFGAIKERILRIYPFVTHTDLAIALAVGAVMGALVGLAVPLGIRRWRAGRKNW